MTRFADELRGSEGERCTVTDVRTGRRHEGVIERWNDTTRKAQVRYGNGAVVLVGFGFVELHGDELPGDSGSS